MAIPDDLTIQRELMDLIVRQPRMRVSAGEAYRALAQLHPELSPEELTLPYQNSVSKWANCVQFARLHLVEKGWLYRANSGPSPERGVWIATDVGAVQSWAETRTSRVQELAPTIAADLNSLAVEEERMSTPAPKPASDDDDKFIDQHGLPGSDRPEQLDVKAKVYPRDAAVRRDVLLRAQGCCEYCDAEGFKTSDGRMYLETHHIVPLAERGVDRIWNVIGLCSGHHREAHHGAQRMKLRDEFKELMRQTYGLDIEFAISPS